LQTVLDWMSFVSIGCVLGYVICFAVGLGMLIALCCITTAMQLRSFRFSLSVKFFDMNTFFAQLLCRPSCKQAYCRCCELLSDLFTS